MSTLELKLPPPIALTLTALVMWLAVYMASSAPRAGTLPIVAALVLTAVGLTVTVLGVLAFRKARTTINPLQPEAASAIVSSGIYRITRNPMYVGFTAILLGWATYLGEPWAYTGPVLFALFITRFQILPEERALSMKFGRPYDEYRTRVRRWL